MAPRINVETLAAELAQNIRRFYAMATDAQIVAGLGWYAGAHKFCELVARDCGIDKETVIDVVAIMSPRQYWTLQERWTLRLIRNLLAGGAGVGPGTNENKAKAARRLAGDASALSGIKVEAFAANIRGYTADDRNRITLDIWALRGAYGCFDCKESWLKGPRHTAATLAYSTVAAELGLDGRDLQAIVWIVAKNYFETLPRNKRAGAVLV